MRYQAVMMLFSGVIGLCLSGCSATSPTLRGQSPSTQFASWGANCGEDGQACDSRSGRRAARHNGGYANGNCPSGECYGDSGCPGGGCPSGECQSGLCQNGGHGRGVFGGGDGAGGGYGRRGLHGGQGLHGGRGANGACPTGECPNGRCNGGCISHLPYHLAPTHRNFHTYQVPQGLTYPAQNQPPASIQYPYYTTRGPTDFFMK